MEYLIISFLPISTFLLFFLQDKELKRKKVLNIGLVINTIVFFAPFIYLFMTTPSGKNIWSEQSGNGAILWVYLLLTPICMLIQFVLMTLKIVFAFKYKKDNLHLNQ